MLLITSAIANEENDRSEDLSLLTLDRIYERSEFSSKGFGGRWLADGAAYTLLEDSAATPGVRDIVRYDARTGRRSVLVPGAQLAAEGRSKPLKIEQYTFSQDLSLVLIYTNSKRVWRQNSRGDYWVLDRGSGQCWRLGGDADPSSLMFAKFSPTSEQVAYVRHNDIYVEDLRDGTIQQVTHRPSDEIIHGTFDWVYEEEFQIRDGFRWSPDGKSIAFWQLDTSGVPKFSMINNTDSLYPKLITFAHPKVGQQNAACRIGVVRIGRKSTTFLDLPGDHHDHYVARMDWVDHPQRIVLQQLNRLQNANHVMLADPQSGQVQTILEETDRAWVNVHNETFWLDGDQQFTWASERDGWRHIYLGSRSGQPSRLVTPGQFDAIQLLHVDQQQQCLYFIASPHDPTQRFLFRAKLDGSEVRRITPDDASGTHSYRISPNGKWAIHTASSFDVPPLIELIGLPDHRTIRVLEDNSKLRMKLKKLKRSPTEFVHVDIGEGVRLDGWRINPPNLDVKKKYPLLVYVYGEPAGSTVVDRWGGSSYLWHLMLAQRGYIVMSFDNRGTRAPRGRAWRKSIYRQVGIIAPQDQAAAVREVLRQTPHIDSDRVGIWGWSGGGSMSLNAIFKYPDVYRTAIAVAPVPNQRYYDTIYQERYMGLPNDNVEGYVNGSPINFAHQLKGDLLLIHGTGDDNCHYQTTEMLINELIRHNKQFTMMAYPNRTHSIREGKNTTRHLRQLMTRYLEEKLPAVSD